MERTREREEEKERDVSMYANAYMCYYRQKRILALLIFSLSFLFLYFRSLLSLFPLFYLSSLLSRLSLSLSVAPSFFLFVSLLSLSVFLWTRLGRKFKLNSAPKVGHDSEVPPHSWR